LTLALPLTLTFTLDSLRESCRPVRSIKTLGTVIQVRVRVRVRVRPVRSIKTLETVIQVRVRDRVRGRDRKRYRVRDRVRGRDRKRDRVRERERVRASFYSCSDIQTVSATKSLS
jgi:hypothetical protein